jgi:hypothetical protein
MITLGCFLPLHPDLGEPLSGQHDLQRAIIVDVELQAAINRFIIGSPGLGAVDDQVIGAIGKRIPDAGGAASTADA